MADDDADELLRKLAEAKPSWQTDGLGLMGAAQVYSRDGVPFEFPGVTISPMPGGNPLSEVTMPELPGEPANSLSGGTTSTLVVANEGDGEGAVLEDPTTDADTHITTLHARTIKAGTNITVTQTGDTIVIAGEAGGALTLDYSNVGSGAGEVLLEPTLEDDTWTIFARNIKAGTYSRVTQDSTDITIESAAVAATNAGGTDGYVLQDPIGYDATSNTFTITANGVNGATWIAVSQAGSSAPIVIELKPQPGSGRRFLAFESDGTPVLVGETACVT